MNKPCPDMGARVYAVLNQKGGVGKTTLAMNLAAGLARRGSCAVLDADLQASVTLCESTD